MKVWDLATRLYHWLQALLFIALLVSGNSGNGPHVQLGLALLTLILWRLIWGFVGSETSRFRYFVSSPITSLKYAAGRVTAKVGHNPLGAWMVLSLLSALLIQCLSGLALAGLLDGLPLAHLWLTDTIFELLARAHVMLAGILPVLVGVHLAAILIYKLRGKGLVRAMITGVQNHVEAVQPVAFVSQGYAFLMLVVATLVTMAIIALSMI
ncbi:cytochrome b/b6 domain-containing protein [Vibrio scophthalmi]|uniref:Cytochrome b561 bacterial/Ni-hydrogenase domain-containing protein n=1 Tax=Vibrio scophthalmi TaxID=45658 RepID=A0A1E3WHM9_9VIBR|nr:cytochrome b/b6 domain-containing protein [Vibrio scophthalmi]MCY9804510.1 cytochrome b/b6 domain-containing protein [Vibrio scophthalmi]ODS05309.1 hypothetical protein VSF3289_04450 [Vibrio scophthalmi]